MKDEVQKIEIDGDNNVILQNVNTHGEIRITSIKFDDFVEKYVIEKNREIDLLYKQIYLLEESTETKIKTYKIKLEQLTKEKKVIESRVKELLETFSSLNLINISKDYKTALNIFMNGDVERALEILSEDKLVRNENEILRKQRKEKEDLAKSRIFRAELLAIQSKYSLAKTSYEKAIKIYPSLGNLHSFGKFLSELRYIKEAEEIYNKIISKFDEKTNDKNDFLIIARTYNNLGVSLQFKHDYETAFNSFSQALNYFRKAFNEHDDAYLRYKAITLDNIGNLKYQQNIFKDSLTFFREAIAIRERLAKRKDDKDLDLLAQTLNNISGLYFSNDKRDEAEENWNKSYFIRKKLYDKNPDKNDSYFCRLLVNMGHLYSDTSELDKAVDFCIQAIIIAKKGIRNRPNLFFPLLAHAHNILSITLSKKGQHEAAYKENLEMVNILKKLSKVDKEIYLPDLAMALNNQSSKLFELKKLKEGLQSLNESIEIRRMLVVDYPKIQRFKVNLAWCLTNLARFYTDQIENKNKSVEAAKEAIKIIFPIKERTPLTKGVFKESLAILMDWGIDTTLLLYKLSN